MALKPIWNVHEVIAENLEIPINITRNLVELFEADNTIPFICRYRKHLTNNMDVDKIRMVKHDIESLKSVLTKMKNSFGVIERQGNMTRDIQSALESSRTLEQIEHIYAPFKPGNKQTLAARARLMGLENLAMTVLKNPCDAPQNKFADFARKSVDLVTLKDALLGCQHIIADVISKDKNIMDKVWGEVACYPTRIETQKSHPEKIKAKMETKNTKAKADDFKFERYFEFSSTTRTIQPYQVLAINRGEKQKVLLVKVTLNDHVFKIYKQTCNSILLKNSMFNFQVELIERSVNDSFLRLVQPMMIRHIRSELQKTAHHASVNVFALNLKRLLLVPPVRGKIVLGLDPGFTHGCKCAVVSEVGKIIHTDIVYLHGYKINSNIDQQKLVNIIRKHRSETVAIGNGTACRETETVVSNLIKLNSFGAMNVMYCIVNENGASIYSVSDQAQKEMPDLDPSYRGAVSIARRLQDPLAELVKIEPKHMGVGMYQHDINETLLQTSLNCIVEECVSFVGVDINSCSECLLKHVSGLSAARAKNIIHWRDSRGPFCNREDLKLVKGIGDKTYQQCVGFIRVSMVSDMSTAGDEKCETAVIQQDRDTEKAGQKRKASAVKSKNVKKPKLTVRRVEPLDRTAIHPESYEHARRFMDCIAVESQNIGQHPFIERVKAFMECSDINKLSETFRVDVHTMQLIVDGLMQPLEQDYRESFEKPLFKNSVMTMSDIKVGLTVTGKVVNVTPFGAFLDIGLDRDTLLHNSKMRSCNMNGKNCVELGDRVEVRVYSKDEIKNRIGVELVKLW